jgi:predicted permease
VRALGWLTSIWHLLTRRNRVEADLAEQIELHIAERRDELIAGGLSLADAERQSRIEFGSTEKFKEECRESLGARLLHDLGSDLRYGFRTLRRNPLLTSVLLLCLAIGIGANTAIFSVANAVLLKSLPIEDPQDLVSIKWDTRKDVPPEIRQYGTGYGELCFPYQTYAAFAGQADRLRSLGITGVLAYTPASFLTPNVKVVIDGSPSMASGELVTGDYFSTLGAKPAIGRVLRSSDLAPSAPLVAVLSDRCWRRAFAQNPSAIGAAINLNGLPATVVGVLRSGFSGLDPANSADIWIPMRGDAVLFPWGATPQKNQTLASQPGWWWLPMFVRQRPGMTPRQVEDVLTPFFRQSITAEVHKRFSNDELPFIKAEPAPGGLNALKHDLSKQLYVLMAAVGLLLLIGCSNVAMLLLARGNARQREMSVRLATGASRSRILRQVLTESLILSLAGGLLGTLLALWISRALLPLIAGSNAALTLSVAPDFRVLAFSLGIATLTGLLFGLGPAINAVGADPFPSIKESAHNVVGASRLTSPLIVFQIALSLLLLMTSGLFIQTLHNLQKQPIGFESRNLLLFALDPRSDGYKGARLLTFYNNVLAKLNALPGVRSATLSVFSLFSGWSSNGSLATDGLLLNKANQNDAVYWNSTGARYLDTMRIALLTGRDLNMRDMETRQRVAILNQALARKYFGSINVLGRRFSLSARYDAAHSWEVVGVSRDAKFSDVRSEAPPTAYVSYTDNEDALGRMNFAVSTIGDPSSMIPAVQKAIASLDAQLPLISVQTQEQLMNDSLRGDKVFANLTTAFAAIALLLAIIGLYGSLAYSVSRRTGELGVRMALGADPRDVVWLILKNSLLLVAAGTAGGWLLSWACTRLIASSLFDVRPMDAATLIAATLVMLAVSALASYLPARRASQVDPLLALRYE